MTGHSVREAAAYFHVHIGTIRKWIRNGCPCELGSVGRTHGSVLDVDAVQRWLQAQRLPQFAERSENAILTLVAKAFADAMRTDGLAGQTIAVERIILLIYARLFLNLKHRPLEAKDLPDEMKRISANFIESVELGNHQRR